MKLYCRTELPLPVLPPHAPDDWNHVRSMSNSLDDLKALPPVVVIQMPDRFQAITGSHRISAWDEFKTRTGKDLFRAFLVQEKEVRKAFEYLRLPDNLEAAWQHLNRAPKHRIGHLTEALHDIVSDPQLKQALAGQW